MIGGAFRRLKDAKPIETRRKEQASLGFLPFASTRWYVLAMMSCAYTLSIADRYVMSTVLEPMRVELALSDTGVNVLTGIPLAIFYVSFGVPLAWMIDRGNRRNILVASIISWSLLTVMCARASSYAAILATRIGVGVGEAGGAPAANSLLSDWFSAPDRAMALTVFSLGAPIGAWLAAQFAGRIADLFGWHMVFVALGLPGILLGVLIMASVGEPTRGRLDRRTPVPAPAWTTVQFLFRQKSVVKLIAAGAMAALWGWGLMWFLPTYLQRMYMLTPGQAGAILGPMHFYGGISATLFTGWLVSRPVFFDSCRVTRLLGVGVALATVPSIILIYTHSLVLVKVGLWVFVPAIYFYIGPSFGLLNNLAPAAMRAQLCAVSLLVVNAANLLLAPLIVGSLSDHFGHHGMTSAESLRFALMTLAPLGFWAAWLFLQSGRTIAQDQHRAAEFNGRADALRRV